MNTQYFWAIGLAYLKAWYKMKEHNKLFMKWKNPLNYPGPDPFTVRVQIKNDFPFNIA